MIIGILGAAVASYLLSRPGTASGVTPGQPVHVVVEPGSSTAVIAESLAAAGVIDSALMFRWDARRAGVDGTLKAGEYDMTTGMTFDQVVEQLTAGIVIEYVDVPIPEGFTYYLRGDLGWGFAGGAPDFSESGRAYGTGGAFATNPAGSFGFGGAPFTGNSTGADPVAISRRS